VVLVEVLTEDIHLVFQEVMEVLVEVLVDIMTMPELFMVEQELQDKVIGEEILQQLIIRVEVAVLVVLVQIVQINQMVDQEYNI
jgi:hypothetical protein